MSDYNTFHEGEPFEDLEVILAAVGHSLVAKGRLEDAVIFSQSNALLEYLRHDNWDGGTSVWNLCIEIPYPNYAAYSEEERTGLEKFIDDVMKPFQPDIGHWISAKLKALPFKDKDWRKNVGKAAQGSEVNNQGRAHSANVAQLEFDGLKFRSEPEIILYKALKEKGIPFAPLPVFIRGGQKFSRVEPDFVLMKDGVVIFVEVDGQSFHKESPADAHYRLKPFQDEGVIVERVKAEHCNTTERARRYANHLEQLIQKRIHQK